MGILQNVTLLKKKILKRYACQKKLHVKVKRFWKIKGGGKFLDLKILIMEIYSVKKLNQKYRSSENTKFLLDISSK